MGNAEFVHDVDRHRLGSADSSNLDEVDGIVRQVTIRRPCRGRAQKAVFREIIDSWAPVSNRNVPVLETVSSAAFVVFERFP